MRLVRNGPFGLLVCSNPSGGRNRNGHYGEGLLAEWRRQITFVDDDETGV